MAPVSLVMGLARWATALQVRSAVGVVPRSFVGRNFHEDAPSVAGVVPAMVVLVVLPWIFQLILPDKIKTFFLWMFDGFKV